MLKEIKVENQEKGKKTLRERVIMFKCREYQTFFDFKRHNITIEQNIVDVIFEAVYNFLKGTLREEDDDKEAEIRLLQQNRKIIQETNIRSARTQENFEDLHV